MSTNAYTKKAMVPRRCTKVSRTLRPGSGFSTGAYPKKFIALNAFDFIILSIFVGGRI